MFQRIHTLAWVCGVVLLGIALALSLQRASASRAPEPDDTARANNVFGPWTTQDGNGVIAIEQCGEALCGRIVGIVRGPGEPIPKDVHGVSQCGLTIISKEKPTGDGSWLGEVVDPRSGKTYGAELWLDNRGNLRLRGFVGLPLLGQTQTWRRFTGRVTETCEVA